MNEYARNVGGAGVVAGVTPGKSGQEIHGVPVYNTVREALCSPDAGVGVIFVPGGAAGDSVMEVSAAGIPLAVVITEHIPVHDTMKAIAFARLEGCDVIGPNCPGLLSPGEIKLGIMPAHLFSRGSVGVISRSGTLTYEIVDELTKAGLGQSSVNDYKERCIFCDVIRQELAAGERVIDETRHFVVMAPFAPRFPFETWIFPKRHLCSYLDVAKDELMDLARTLRTALTRLSRTLNNPPYNFMLYTAPNRMPRRGHWHTLNDDFHWHLEIIPRLTRTAGFEWGTGFYINHTPPEAAAKYLREVKLT